MFCVTDNILLNILHIQFEYGEYSIKYCQSHKTLLWIWIMLCTSTSKKQTLKSYFIFIPTITSMTQSLILPYQNSLSPRIQTYLVLTSLLPCPQVSILREAQHLSLWSQWLIISVLWIYCFLWDYAWFYIWKIACFFFDWTPSCRAKREETMVETNNHLEVQLPSKG